MRSIRRLPRAGACAFIRVIQHVRRNIVARARPIATLAPSGYPSAPRLSQMAPSPHGAAFERTAAGMGEPPEYPGPSRSAPAHSAPAGDGPAGDAAAPAAKQVIALVDDDRNILTSVSIGLQAEGFVTRVYADGASALKACLENPPDLAIFDIKMPRMDGYELLQRLRAKSALPVIFLTSRDGEPDEALGLAMGADDYIAKPFSQRLLVARIRAILRRHTPARSDAAAPAGDLPDPVRRGRLTLDPARHEVRWDGRPVSLTVTEFLILEALAARPGVIKSRNQLMDAAYSDDIYVDDRTIDSHIKRLRRKFRSVDPGFGAVETLYGAGYSFADG